MESPKKEEPIINLTDVVSSGCNHKFNDDAPRSVIRRKLAVAILSVWLFLICLSSSVFLISASWSKFIFEVMEHMFWVVMSIIGFLYGGYTYAKYVKK